MADKGHFLIFIMKKNLLHSILIILICHLAQPSIKAQDTIPFESINSLKDIPHRSFSQKMMWPHRAIVFMLVKEKEPYYDTTYIKSYKKQLVASLPISTRFMRFTIDDLKTGKKLKFVPNSHYDLGININSKFASFLLHTGVTFFENDRQIKGKTEYKDIQFNLYRKRTTTDFNIQTYKSFYVKNANDYQSWDTANTTPYAVRPDISAFQLGCNVYYIFNYKKFSYRNSFAFTEQQLKSSGSPLVGGYYSVFGVSADSSMSGYFFSKELSGTSNIKSGSVTHSGINLGYIYTLVIKKKLYATFSLVQGIGIDRTVYQLANGIALVRKANFATKQNLRFAIGYDNSRFFYGVMGMFDFYYTDSKQYSNFDYSLGKARIFVGYRFSFEKIQNKVLKKINLIDYRL